MRIQHVLLCLPFLFTSCAQEDHGHAHGDDGHTHAEDVAHWVCPPCGMDMDHDAKTIEAGGMKFAACNDKCAEEVMKDPERFAEFAIQN